MDLRSPAKTAESRGTAIRMENSRSNGTVLPGHLSRRLQKGFMASRQQSRPSSAASARIAPNLAGPASRA